MNHHQLLISNICRLKITKHSPMMAHFLSIPLKQTVEVDLVKPLRTYISSVFKPKSLIEIDASLHELNKLRNMAVVQPIDKHQTSLDILSRYYDQLVAIEYKLPLSPTQVPIAFQWKDAFDKGSIFFSKASLTLSYGLFERAAVLFNIGALMSQIAAAQSLGTDEELKSAAKLFQQSAGCFAQLKDFVLTLAQQDLTPDLMPDTLHAIFVIMIAQGQEAIYMKASKDQMKSSLLVKIAAQCGDFYQDAIMQMNRDSVKRLWERDWTNIVNAKVLMFQALAHYHQSCENNEKKQIGDELARLQESIRLIRQAQNYMTTQLFVSEIAMIQKAHDMAKKDNDFIYHERITELRTLSALPRAILSKPIAPSTPMSPHFKDIFASLVPFVKDSKSNCCLM